MINKIISGGQTGADQGGLFAAKALGIETGGTAPPKFMTERGSEPTKLKSLGLVEGKPDSSIYKLRTRQNILDSDGTVVFGKGYSPGTTLTIKICKELKRPWIHNPGCLAFLKWIVDNNIQVLNVAGNRESKYPGIQDKVHTFLVEALKD